MIPPACILMINFITCELEGTPPQAKQQNKGHVSKERPSSDTTVTMTKEIPNQQQPHCHVNEIQVPCTLPIAETAAFGVTFAKAINAPLDNFSLPVVHRTRSSTQRAMKHLHTSSKHTRNISRTTSHHQIHRPANGRCKCNRLQTNAA